MIFERKSHSAKCLVGVVALLVAISSCGPDDSDVAPSSSNSIVGTLQEWSVTTNASRAEAGEVTFTITNEGSIEHEFLIVKTDYPAGQIPLEGSRFSEDAEGIDVIDELEGMISGESRAMTVQLSTGSYQLVCNIDGHYSAGMHTSLTVE